MSCTRQWEGSRHWSQIAPEDHLNPVSSMQEVAERTIRQYEEGEIDAIWCCYEPMLQGVYQALREVDSDIPYGNPWIFVTRISSSWRRAELGGLGHHQLDTERRICLQSTGIGDGRTV